MPLFPASIISVLKMETQQNNPFPAEPLLQVIPKPGKIQSHPRCIMVVPECRSIKKHFFLKWNSKLLTYAFPDSIMFFCAEEDIIPSMSKWKHLTVWPQIISKDRFLESTVCNAVICSISGFGSNSQPSFITGILFYSQASMPGVDIYLVFLFRNAEPQAIDSVIKPYLGRKLFPDHLQTAPAYKSNPFRETLARLLFTSSICPDNLKISVPRKKFTYNCLRVTRVAVVKGHDKNLVALYFSIANQTICLDESLSQAVFNFFNYCFYPGFHRLILQSSRLHDHLQCSPYP